MEHTRTEKTHRKRGGNAITKVKMRKVQPQAWSHQKLEGANSASANTLISVLACGTVAARMSALSHPLCDNFLPPPQETNTVPQLSSKKRKRVSDLSLSDFKICLFGPVGIPPIHPQDMLQSYSSWTLQNTYHLL